MGPYFTPGLFDFLKQLKRNNRREWFAKNKARYEAVVRDPCLQFITEAAAPLQKISSQIIADPRPHGGSLFRIYRDIRFSANKQPYKTHIGIQFRHASEKKDVHAPSFYFHLEPEQCFVAGGSWRPESKVLNQIRQAIVTREDEWKKISKKLKFDGEVLSRPPRGFPPDHPCIEDLKRKDYIVWIEFSESQICGPKFMKDFTRACQQISPLVQFLSQALGFRY
ncbi:MAG TPA: DUF2461 domain-containing protein [Terriglobales bacterium]|nr:DUF2461 domain-containing protein [Terriglobales bacterium]